MTILSVTTHIRQYKDQHDNHAERRCAQGEGALEVLKEIHKLGRPATLREICDLFPDRCRKTTGYYVHKMSSKWKMLTFELHLQEGTQPVRRYSPAHPHLVKLKKIGKYWRTVPCRG